MTSRRMATLVLSDGRTFRGRAFGAVGQATGEVVFNTGMSGYQEILTDPSYCGQMVCMTYPHIGNYGVNPSDVEGARVRAAGFIVRDLCETASSWRSTEDLSPYLEKAGVVGITDLDTRALTRHIRNLGAMNGVISTVDENSDNLVNTARSVPSMTGQNLVDQVTCPEPYRWTEGLSDLHPSVPVKSEGKKPHVVVYDYGAKFGILRALVSHGFEVTVVPASMSASDVLQLEPDGIMLSNGPGDPAAVDYAIETVRNLLGKKPIFGVCLGHQLLALALGMETYKLKFGHHGCNHPVKDLDSGSIAITSQNHGFAVKPDSLPSKVRITHQSLYDGTVEGLECPEMAAFSVQYHPEAGPGPNDALGLFGVFRSLVAK